MNRPGVTRELIAAVAAKFARDVGWDDSRADDLVQAYRPGKDGYQLAKVLDDCFGWCPDATDVDTLDSFDWRVRQAHRKVCFEWAKENNIQPPLPVGTLTTRGVIAGISEHEPATYTIKENGCTQEGRYLLVRFEDARPAAAVAVGAA